MADLAQLSCGRSWLLSEQHSHFELGHILNSAVTDALEPQIAELGPYHAGLWECDLTDQSLIWSGGVYDLFGLRRGTPLKREQVLAHYIEDSRQKLERLRDYAIAQRRGFTLDVEIRDAAVGSSRRVRVVAAPLLKNGLPTRLHGLKLAL